MFDRFRHIHSRFGRGELIRTLVLLIGLFGMAGFGLLAFSSFIPAAVAVVGIVLGWLLRKVILHGIEYYSLAIPVGLVIYSGVLFFGQRFGMDRVSQLTVITVTTVIVFDLKFWSLSDPEVLNVAE